MPSSHLILCCPILLRQQSLPASGSFPMRQLFTWGGQSIGVSALASFLPVKSQGWSPVGWTGRTSLQSKGLSRVFSNITVQRHQFFSAQLSLWSTSHIHTWFGKTIALTRRTFFGKVMSLLFGMLSRLSQISSKEQASFFYWTLLSLCSRILNEERENKKENNE